MNTTLKISLLFVMTTVIASVCFAAFPVFMPISVKKATFFAPEICNNGIDDDADGLIDCADNDCIPVVTHSIIDCQPTNADINLTVASPNTPIGYRWSDMVAEAIWSGNNTTNDASGNAHNLGSGSVGTITYDAADKVEGSHAFNFDGATYLRYGIDGGFLETAYSNRSYSIWVKPANLTGIKILFEQGSSTAGIAARLNGNLLSAAYRAAGTQYTTGTLTFPADGAWHHVAVVFNSGTMTCYLDGVASTTATSAATSIAADANNDALGARNGTDAFGSVAANNYAGKMDDVRLFYSALTAQQVADIARNDGDRLNLTAGTYTVTVTNSIGCSATKAINLALPCTVTASPGGVTGAAIWLKADAGVTTGTTLTWADQTGNNRNGVQSSVNNKPVLTASSVNFNPALTFDGANDYLSLQNLPGLPTGASQVEEFAVANNLNTSGYWQHILNYGNNSNLQAFGLSKNNANANAVGNGYGQDAISSGLEFTNGAPALLDGKYNGTELVISSFGVERATFTSAQNRGTSVGYVGVDPGLNSSTHWNGNIPEIILFPTNLTAANVLRVNSYLAIKYGITLDQTTAQNYLASDGTTIFWNGTTNSGNKKNIAGIARDDASGLNQKQSKSSNFGFQVVIGNGNTIAATNAANSNNFATDKSALVWSDNAGSVAAWTSTGAPTGKQIIARTWKVQETGTVGSVKVQVADNSGTNGLPIESGTILMLVDADGNFTSGATTIPMTLNGTNWEANVDLTNGQFFTFANGCTFSLAGSQTNVTTCFGGTNGSINITASGGTAPYTYDWDDIAGTSNVEDRTGLAAGTYIVAVYDNAGCAVAVSYTITQPSQLATSTAVTGEYPAGFANGAINLTVTGGTSPFTFDWADLSGSGEPEDRSGLSAGTYSVTVSDANGCTVSTSATVETLVFVNKQLYLSDPSQALDRVDPVAMGDASTASVAIVSCPGIATSVNSSGGGDGVSNPSYSLGAPDGAYATLNASGSEYIVLDLGAVVPQGNNLTIAMCRIFGSGNSNGGGLKVTASSDLDFSNDPTNNEIGLTDCPTSTNRTYTVTQSTGVRYVKLEAFHTAGNVVEWNFNVDGIQYSCSGVVTSTTFTQSPALCSPLTIKANQPINVTNYVTISSGSMPANPNITALLKYGATEIISLTNPSYNIGTGLLTWTGTLPSDVTVPAGQAIALEIATKQSGVTFTIDYDSQTKPSKIELPVSTFIDISSYSVYSAAYPGGSIITNAVGGTTVYPRAVVTDPFGFSDITGMDITINPPGTTVAATSVATAGCTRTYQYTWTTPSSSGTFAIPATAKEGFEDTVTDGHALNFDLCSPTIGTPVFTLGASSTRCQGAGSVTYTATATSSTGITYSLDAASLAAGNTISSITGAVTYAAGWSGTTTITATATGCGGPKTAAHVVTVTPTVGTPVFTLGATSTRCQGATTTTFSATATNATGITYSLDAASLAAGNTIVGATGAVTFTTGWTNSSIITASAAGCNGPSTATHMVSTTLAVATPVFTLGATSTRCQGASTVTYTATAANTTGITYTLDATSLAAGNTINAATGAVTYAAGWSGTSIVTASAAGCTGPKTATHTVTVTPNGALTFALGSASNRASGAGTVSYTATATNGGAVTYSLDAASLAAGNTINSSTGAVTYTAGWSGIATITASVNGCAGTQTATHTSQSSVFKQLYLSDPSQALDRMDPVATADATMASVNVGSQSCSELIINGEFNSGTADWSLFNQSGNTSTWSVDNTGQLSGANSAKVVVTAATGTDWHVEFDQEPFTIYAGQQYTIYFDAKALAPRTIGMVIQERQSPWTPYFNVTVNLTTTPTTFGPFTFTASVTQPLAGILFRLGTTTGTVYIDNVKLQANCAAANSATFTQAPALCTPLQMPAGGTVTVTNYISPIGLSGTVTKTIAAGSDDAEEAGPNATGSHPPGYIDMTSTDIELTTDTDAGGGYTGGTQKIGLRFTGLNIPPGATITNAYLTFGAIGADSPNTNTGATSLTIKAQAADNPTTFTTTTNNISSRTTTTASVAWSPGSWTSGTAYNSPNISSVVQELVNRPGWANGNSMAFIITGTGSRSADAFDGNSANAPKLTVEYSLPGTSFPANPNVTATLKHGTTTFATLTNPTYNSGTGLLTWTGTLGTVVTAPAGAAISLTVTNGETTPFSIQYDSQTKPSKVNLPVSTYIDITSYSVYNAAYPGGSIISNAIGGTTVYPRAVVSDPFGFSDITGMNITITPPGTTVAATSVATAGCTRSYEYSWTTPFSSGSFSIPATAKEGFENAVTDVQALSFDLCSPTIATPVFALGATSTRCQGAGSVTYTATSTSSTGITYSLDAASLSAGNTISSVTGAVTYAAGWSGTTTVTATATGCGGPKTATHTVTVTPTVGTPVFALGATSTRCQGATTSTFSATATNSTGMTYSLDAASLAAGNTIVAGTGAVTFVAGWTTNSTITASAAGCNGPKTATHVVSTTLAVTTPVFALGATSTRCQGSGTVTYTASASNTTGITYSLDAASLAAGNTINATTGAVTYAAGWSGTTVITTSATGCTGPKTATHTVTVTPQGTLTFALGATSTRAFGAGTVTYTATANNGGVVTYSLDANSLAAGNTINASTGLVTYTAFWVGTSTITASVNGCAGTQTATHAASTNNVYKQLYLSDPTQALDRVDPVATADATTAQTGILSSTPPAVVLDATTTNFSANPGSTTFSVSHTTGTGANRLMLVGISQKNKLVSSVTYGGTPLTLVGEEIDNGNARMHLYSLINPPSGTANVVVNLSANPDKGIIVGVTTFSGVDQATPLGNFAGTQSGGGNPSVNVSSAVGELVYDVVSIRNASLIIGAGQTQRWKIDSGGEMYGGGGTETGAASTTMSWSSSDDETDWAIGAVSIKPASAITNTTFTQSPALCSPLTIKAGQPIAITNYVSITSGTMPANPNITALLKYGTTNIISLGSPTYNSGSGLLTWTGTLGSDVTVPAGQAIALQITTAQAGVTFKIDYDSQTKPSKINLPVSTFIDITSYAVYNAAYPAGSIINTAVTGATVYPRAVVSDPFGFSDITGMNITITPPGTTVSATSVATAGCTRLYQYTWNTAALGGTYSLPATAKEGFENTVADLQALNFDICSPTIGTPVFALGATSTRCQGAGLVTYTATSTSSTGMSYSLDAASIAAGNTINTATGAVTYLVGWTGTSVITATATGCGGPKTSTHTVTMTPFVGTPVFALGATSIRCQGAGTVTYTASATYSTGIIYSLNAAALAGGNTINAATGAVTYSAGWTGSTIITASAAGCNGPAVATHTVTITLSVSTPVFALGASSGRCGGGYFVYTATAANSTGITYSLDAASLVSGNSIDASTGAVTFVPTWLSNSVVTATATGCNGPAIATHTVSISSACPPIANDDAANGAGGAPLPINVAANDTDINNNINPSSVAIVTQPQNGSAVISGGQVVYLPNGTFLGVDQFTYRICDATAPTPLCDTATVVVTIDPITVDACSDAVKGQVYYLPYPEQDARLALIASTGAAWLPIPSNNIRTIISIKIPYPGMTLVYDHWEDGFEADPNNPIQSTTQVWGDGNPYNGIAPGYLNDDLPAGAAIVLDNTMPANPRVAANIFYDGKDKIVSSGAITVTQVLGEPSIIFVQCMKTNVTSTANYGESFTIPVGENFNSQDFRYTALFIRASEDNTTINIDKDNNGTFETTTTLNEGQSYFVNGGVLSGAVVTSSAPIGVDLHFGGVDGYSSREAPIFPATWYSDVYYTPVPSTLSPDSAVVMLYNSLNRAIDINWYFGTSSSGTITLPAKTVKRFPLAISSTQTYKFINPTGESFTAIQIVDSYTPGGGGNSGSTYDWAFNLISEDRLTSFAAIAWAPGSINGTANGNPIWVTPAANTTIYVKYDGDVINGGSVSPCGLHYDVSYALNELNYKKLLDSDNDQSGLAVYTCDGTKIAAAYGEDPSLSTPASPYWDVGSTIQPFCGEKLILANNDFAYTLTNQPVTISVLKNDRGFLAVIDPATLTTTGYLPPKNGTVSVNSNGTMLYIPNNGFVGSDTLEYGICSTPGSPPNVVCDRALVIIRINACPAPAQRNIISGQVFLDKNKDGVKNDGGTGFSPAKVYLYVDGNCNSAINTNELVDSVIVDNSGSYQFLVYPEKIVSDNFDGAGGTNTCATGTDGTAAWATNWVDAGDASVGYCVSPAQSAANTDVEIVADGAFGNALRLDDLNKSATRTVNLSGATYAFLSFSYRKASNTLASGENIRVQASPNGSTWTTIFTIPGNGTTDAGYVPIYNQNIINYASSSTRIRFLTDGNVDEGDHVFIDDISIRYLRYPQCYITRIAPASIPADMNLTTPAQYAQTASNAGTCLAPLDFGVAKNNTTISGTLYNDSNGLSDGLVNGTAFGSPSGATVYAYLIDAAGEVRFKTTVNSATGAYTFPQADVNSSFTLMISTTNVALFTPAPTSANLPTGWASTGEAFGTNNGAGTGIEVGVPNSAITVTTNTLAVTGANIGIQQVNAGPDRLACISGSVTMAATTTPGTWSAQVGNPGTAVITTPTSPTTTITGFSAPGTYSFLWTNNGVSDIATVTVYADPAFTVQAAGFTECVGGTQAVSVIATGGIPPLTYQWQSSADNVTFANISGATSTTYTPPSTTAGTTYFRAIVTPGPGGCSPLTSATAPVVIVADPAITVQPSNITECVAAGLQLGVTATGGVPPLTYQWQSSTNNSVFNNIAGATASTYIPPDGTPGTNYYRVIVGSAGNGCGSTTSASATVTVTAFTGANAGPDVSICTGHTTTLTASGGSSYVWNNGLGTGASKTVTPLTTTAYTVTVTDASGCNSTDEVVVTVTVCQEICDNGLDDDTDGLIDCLDNDCVPTIDVGTNVNICIGSSYVLNATATGGTAPYTFNWDNGLGAGQTHTVYPLVTTTYQVTVTSATGCIATNSVTITVVNCPENCTDGIDNDGDGLVDCADPECLFVGAPQLANDVFETCPGEVFVEQPIYNDVNIQYPVYSITTPATKGSVTINSMGVFTYSPYNSACGVDSFRYQVCNAVTGCCDQATVLLQAGDNLPPTLMNLPADVTIGCGDPIPVAPTVIGLDVCPGIYMSFDENNNQGSPAACQNYHVIRTWTAYDLCGNSTVGTQTITVADEVEPELFRVYTLSNGKKLLAGIAEKVRTTWTRVKFPIAFDAPPLVFAQVITANGSEPITIRVKDVDEEGFFAKVQEQEQADGIHVIEQIAWMAMEVGKTSDAAKLQSGLATGISSAPTTINYTNPYTAAPVLLAFATTHNEADPFTIRFQTQTINNFRLFLDEEQSLDAEKNHGAESVAWLALNAGSLNDIEGDFIGHAGSVTIGNTWTTVPLPKRFSKPVVLFGGQPIGNDPASIRVRNVTANSFEVRIEEWPYLNNLFTARPISYMVVEGSLPAEIDNPCTQVETSFLPGINLFAVDDCDNQVTVNFTESSTLTPAGTVRTNNWVAADDCGNAYTLIRTDTCNMAAVRVNVLLGGGLVSVANSTLMRDKLREKQYLPSASPYWQPDPDNNPGGANLETIPASYFDITGPTAMVDWVLVELRDPVEPTIVLGTKSALLLRNGTVIGTNGSDILMFDTTEAGDYYVSLKHRNHLGIMTANPKLLDILNPPLVDFTSPNEPLYESEHAQRLVEGTRRLWPGDLNGDGKVIYQGPNNDAFKLFFDIMTHPDNYSNLSNFIRSGYEESDLNLDGNAIYQGPTNDRAMLLQHTILAIPTNTLKLSNYIAYSLIP